MFNLQYWVVCGISSCLIFTAHERYMLRAMGLADAMVLLLMYTTFILVGPIGLALISVASLITFLSNR